MKKGFVLVLVLIVTMVFFTHNVPDTGPNEYVVQPGDTLAEIAARHGVTVDDLVAMNRDPYPSLVEHPERIEVGWRLRVPGKGQGLAVADVQEKAGRVAAYVDALAMTAVAPEPEPTPTPDSFGVRYYYYRHPRDPQVVAREIFDLTNKERTKRGLAPLAWDRDLVEIARWRVQDMVKRNYYSHYDPETGRLLVRERCNGCGENLAGRYIPTGQAFVNAWMNSSGHRANILNPRYTAIGVGVARRGTLYIAVQVFR